MVGPTSLGSKLGLTPDVIARWAGGSGFVTLTGAGDYEGLVAYIALGPDLDPDAVDAATARNFEGVIFLGEAPVQPELPTP